MLWQVEAHNWLLVDSYDYLSAANSLQESGTLFSGDLYESPPYEGNYTRRPPVYPVFLAIISLFSESHVLTTIVQMGFSFLAFFLFLKIYSLVYSQKEPPLYLLAFLICYPAQYIYTNLVMAESLFQVLIMGSIYFLLRGVKEESWKLYLLHSLLLLVAVLTKPVLYLLIPLHGLTFMFFAWKKKKSSYMLAAFVPLLVLILYVHRNYQKTGYVHVSSVENINLIHYPVSYIMAREYEPMEADQKVDKILREARAKSTFKEEQEFLRKSSFEVIGKHPLLYIQLHLRGMLNFFLDPGRFDIYHFFSIKTEASQGLMATFGKEGYSGIWNYLKKQPLLLLALMGAVLLLNLIKFIAFCSFPFYTEIDPRYKWVIIGCVIYLAGITGVMGASRFAMPVFFLLLLSLPAAAIQMKKSYFRIKSQ